ncbi:HAD-IA family hydrolase [Actinacidiphila acidipaludis]|uniref:HAD-IA family hydrolase n=1 Tax=Actinacidiphila acidipaludis TaxID=2873382 RepID=A0ABS7QD90_9ACTN|nr:HAD-IA family hydrolase [Streptomyces acidipaludis]MBY8881097.1 HAD-IA family hydrolase [Streptomyces acidipaludis]
MDRVYAFWRRWRDRGLTTELHDRLRDRARRAADRDTEPTAVIIDAQSVKGAASVPAATRGFDAGKKVNGRKRRIVVDTLGLLLAVMVTAASVTDREAAQTYSSTEVSRGKPAPDLFLHAAQRMGVDPEACVVVEDSQPGVHAARAAGMRALGYAGGLTPAERLEGRNTTVFYDMRELPTLIAER